MKWAELLVPFFNVVYVVIAFVMIVIILMQRGAGAQAGSSFGAGASGTVFGAQGSANFLSRTTAICATLFFLISIGMGVYISHSGRPKAETGLMSNFADPAKTEVPASELPTAATMPGAPAASTPAPVTASTATPAPAATPASDAVTTPAEVPSPKTPAEAPPTTSETPK